MKNTVLISLGLLVSACAPVLLVATQGPPPIGGVGLVISKPWAKSAQSIVASSNLHEVGPMRGRLGSFVVIETNESVQTSTPMAHGSLSMVKKLWSFVKVE